MTEQPKQTPRTVTLPPGVKFLGIWKTTDLAGLPVQLLTRPLRPDDALEEYTVLAADLGAEPTFTPELMLREQAAETPSAAPFPLDLEPRRQFHTPFNLPPHSNVGFPGSKAEEDLPASIAGGTEEDNV